jgi:hypothetical protein
LKNHGFFKYFSSLEKIQNPGKIKFKFNISGLSQKSLKNLKNSPFFSPTLSNISEKINSTKKRKNTQKSLKIT